MTRKVRIDTRVVMPTDYAKLVAFFRQRRALEAGNPCSSKSKFDSARTCALPRHMRFVRSKFMMVVALCLLPVGAATWIFFWASHKEIRSDTEAQMHNARAAFALEFQDDLAQLQVDARWLTTDPDVARELAAHDAEMLHEHLDDFDGVYRVYLTDARGAILASSHERAAHGSLAAMPELRGALAGQSFDGITQLALQHPEPEYAYALVRPIASHGVTIGALLAAFALDQAYFDDTAKKEGVALSFPASTIAVVAESSGYPAHEVKISGEGIDIRELPDGRELALAAFVPSEMGAGALSVTIARDVTTSNCTMRSATSPIDSSCSPSWPPRRSRSVFSSRILLCAQLMGTIARALPGVALKKYVRVEGVRTGVTSCKHSSRHLQRDDRAARPR